MPEEEVESEEPELEEELEMEARLATPAEIAETAKKLLSIALPPASCVSAHAMLDEAVIRLGKSYPDSLGQINVVADATPDGMPIQLGEQLTRPENRITSPDDVRPDST